MKDQSSKAQSSKDQFRKGWSTEISTPIGKVTLGVKDEQQSDSRDLEFMLHPERWPYRPELPLRHVSRGSEIPGCPALAIMLEGEGPQVHPCTAWGIGEGEPEVFTSYSEVLAAGWIVD